MKLEGKREQMAAAQSEESARVREKNDHFRPWRLSFNDASSTSLLPHYMYIVVTDDSLPLLRPTAALMWRFCIYSNVDLNNADLETTLTQVNFRKRSDKGYKCYHRNGFIMIVIYI